MYDGTAGISGSKTCAVTWVSHIFWCLLVDDWNFCWLARKLCLAAADCVLWDAEGEAGTADLYWELRSLLLGQKPWALCFPLQNSGFCCSSSTSIFPCLAISSPFLLFSPGEVWAQCCSPAIAIEITPLSLPLLFFSAPLAAPIASSQMCQPATWASCPAEWWAEYPCPRWMPEPLYCTSGSWEVALIGAV